MKVSVYLDELLPSKQAARTLPQVIDSLVEGKHAHMVITRRNKPVAVLLTIENYERLLERAGIQ